MIAEVKKVKPLLRSQYDSKHYNGARAHLEIGFTRLGEQEPYFHALAGVEYKFRDNRWEGQLGRFACCADHNALREHFPELAYLVRWHLASINSGPMHYEANAIFWAELATGKRPPSKYDPNDTPERALENFKRTVAWGAVATDGTEADAAITVTLTTEELGAWLRARFPAMMEAFKCGIDATFPGMWDAALKLPPGRF